MPILHPRIDGWRSDDGYRFSIATTGSKRRFGELITPNGERQILGGSKRDTATSLLEWAEREICAHRMRVA